MAKHESRSGQGTVNAPSKPGPAPSNPPSTPAPTPAPDAPKTVKMEVLRSGSYAGTTYHAGDTFDADEAHVETLHLAGFAARADRVEAGQKARSDEQKATDAASLYKGTNNPGEAKPLTTHDVPGGTPAKE